MAVLSWIEIQRRATYFTQKWKDETSEDAEAKSFLDDFFEVFGVSRKRVALFEHRVRKINEHDGYVDLVWPKHIIVEMKSRGKSLDKAFDQAKDYAVSLPDDQLPDYIMVCDFENIRLYRLSTNQKWTFKTAKLDQHVRKFSWIAGYQPVKDFGTDVEANIKAAKKMAKLHDGLKKVGYDGHNLEIYLVRILFCLFADDTLVWVPNLFHQYVLDSKEDGTDLAMRLEKLFEVLDMSDDTRRTKTLLSEEIKQFTYINGGLFKESLPMADFEAETRHLLLECCDFNWENISPAILGSLFQGVMDVSERDKYQSHYTSKENILKAIKPLFLDNLWEEFERIKFDKQKLARFHEKIAQIKIADFAMGCGNFLCVAYSELRMLEINVLKMIGIERQLTLDALDRLFKISVDQFYGVEILEFPCQIALVAMWLTDHQMNRRVREEFGHPYARYPLTQSARIKHDNALSIDWETVIDKDSLNYIVGNPPFSGARKMTDDQKEDMAAVFVGTKSYGNLDYVCAWYKKAAAFIKDTQIKCALVSTNSITQGQQVEILWKQLIDNDGIHIDFAHRTFKWKNEAPGVAAVHCVIIGFSSCPSDNTKQIYDGDHVTIADNINPYLLDKENIFIESRTTPLCDVPEMVFGSMPNDAGNFLFSEEEKCLFIKSAPAAEKWFRKFVGAEEFINKSPRWCLWLKDALSSEISANPLVLARVMAVRKVRAGSDRAATRRLASYPSLFGEIRQPETGSYILIPCHSSQTRQYIPIGFLDSNTIASNATLIIPGATLYHFGILTSSMHNAWMRIVAGRIKSDYRYSKDIVYNNFPWPLPTEQQRAKIEQCAQAVLDARERNPRESLASLYGEYSMPPELTMAHEKLDREVEKAYGKRFVTEVEKADFLFARYARLPKEVH